MEMTNDRVQLFEDQPIRTAWIEGEEEWYFSIVDVVGVLTESKDALTARKYWNKLKQRLKEEGNETVTNCHQLKLQAADGKMRKTDVADTEQLFRLIQSIPSPKAEPFKQWMAQVAALRLDQMQDPELGIQQALADYKRLGYSDNWINQRLKSIEIRKDLTDDWKRRGLEEGVQFEEQTTMRDAAGHALYDEEEGHRMVPDVILHFRDKRDVIIDSKMSLKAFGDYHNAQTDEERQSALMRHIVSMRNHVNELARKNYSAYIKDGRGKLDFVMMYVYSENALQLALYNEPGLWK